ncbi:MAG: hypothetical protein JO244_06425 [Solirubrobacterales bacterium]|nr:hypothetical protein [Solirubrobacterales bacterium]
MLAKVVVTLGAALGAGALASDALAASLSVRVSPSTLHPGSRYTVTIAGRYNKASRPEAPYLLAFIQYTGRACRSTATAEYSLPDSYWGWELYPQAEGRTPFKSVRYWKVGSRLGSRRICAYLYPSQVGPSTTDKPLALASAGFRTSKRTR